MSDTSEKPDGIDARSALSALDDVRRFETRARRAMMYGDCAAVYFVWGVICLIGYTQNWLMNEWRDTVWLALSVAGLILTAGIALNGARGRRDMRAVWVLWAANLYSYLWFFILRSDATNWRDGAAFFPTVNMFGLVVIGSWMGGAISATGLTVTAAVIAVHALAGDAWFDPLMAIGVGGGSIAAGFLMRRLGDPR